MNGVFDFEGSPINKRMNCLIKSKLNKLVGVPFSVDRLLESIEDSPAVCLVVLEIAAERLVISEENHAVSVFLALEEVAFVLDPKLLEIQELLVEREVELFGLQIIESAESIKNSLFKRAFVDRLLVEVQFALSFEFGVFEVPFIGGAVLQLLHPKPVGDWL